jgi:hypothetical protein
MSKKVSNKRVVELIGECNNAAELLRSSSKVAAGKGLFIERENAAARSRKFSDTASALIELLAFRNARRSTAK